MSEVPAPPRGCPDPSILAAFIEGTLDALTRREVEHHIADCPECPAVIAETARFLKTDVEEADGESDPPPRRHWRWLAAAAAFAALCMASAWQMEVRRDPLWKVKQIAAECKTRPVEGRLVGFEYVPFPLPRSDRKPTVDLALRAEAERLNEGGSSSHARGVALLLVGDVNAALPFLEMATRLSPDDANLWSDLAAAYVATGSEFSRALAAADQAINLAPSLAAAHFNRAVALTHLGRRDEAVHAYRRALDLDERSEWRKEIATRVALLQS
jgi:tetratricopeptide (TPR) repeat protein